MSLHIYLVQSVLRLRLAPNISSASLPADGVDLVDEEDAGCVLSGHGEHVADTGRTHADKHLEELGARHGQEGNISLARSGFGEEGLARSGRSWNKQSALFRQVCTTI